METNPYTYNRTQQQQHQVYQNRPVAENGQQFIQQQNVKTPQRNTGQKTGKQAKMPRERAIQLANALKRTLAAASIIGFGMFGGLVAMHQVSTTTIQSTQSTSNSSNTSSTSSSQHSNNFFNQQGGNTSGTSSSTTSSTTTGSSSSAPVTGTTTS